MSSCKSNHYRNYYSFRTIALCTCECCSVQASTTDSSGTVPGFTVDSDAFLYEPRVVLLYILIVLVVFSHYSERIYLFRISSQAKTPSLRKTSRFCSLPSLLLIRQSQPIPFVFRFLPKTAK